MGHHDGRNSTVYSKQAVRYVHWSIIAFDAAPRSISDTIAMVLLLVCVGVGTYWSGEMTRLLELCKEFRGSALCRAVGEVEDYDVC
jgi:hypothetical protein